MITDLTSCESPTSAPVSRPTGRGFTIDAAGAVRNLAVNAEDVPARHRLYHPHGAAERLFYCRAPEILLVGPAGTGKTRAVLEKLFLCAQRFAGMRALLARKTRASLSQSVLVTLEDKVLWESHPVLTGVSRRYRHAYQFSNRSEFVTGSLDKPDRIMSTEFDMIAAFEATELTLEDWQKLLSRLRNGRMPFQQAIADCNPSYPGHWLNRRAADGLMQRLESRHQDNPSLWDQSRGIWTPAGETYLATLGRLSGVTRSRLLNGHWAAPEGLVYEIVPRHILPDGTAKPPLPAQQVFAGVDWGFHEPTAMVVGVLCADDCLYVVEEYYQTGQVPTDLGQRFQTMVRRWNIEALFCDASRPEMIAQLRRWDILARRVPIKSVDWGIAKVLERIKNGQLKIYDCCANLLREAAEYHYEPGRDGQPAKLPVQIKDHALDALRYLITGLDFHRELVPAGRDEPPVAVADGPNADEIDVPLRDGEAPAFSRDLTDQMWDD